MYTLNQIVQRIKAFATAHEQIKSFHYGYFDDVLTDKDELFPCLVCTPKPKTVGKKDDVFNFEILVADLVRPLQIGETGLGNELEVQSDTDLICKDFLRYFEKAFSDLKITDTANLEDFAVNKTNKEIAGWFFPISIVQFNDHDLCAIPGDFDLPDSEDFATVFDLETDETITTLRMKERYGVYQFSGISGGTPSTVYTNSIVAPAP